jgi:hypothetical protein
MWLKQLDATATGGFLVQKEEVWDAWGKMDLLTVPSSNSIPLALLN